jgi:hypothetical protein
MLHGHFEQTEARWQTFGGGMAAGNAAAANMPCPLHLPQVLLRAANGRGVKLKLSDCRLSRLYFTLLREAELVDNLR